MNSFVEDYVVRQKVGGSNLNFFIVNQFPVVPPPAYTDTVLGFIVPRVLELTFSARDITSFAHDLGYDGRPFRWDEERRFLIRCELDAAFFHLYGLEREDAAYVMETFPIVKRKDEERFGCYRTKETILEIYDAMRRAMDGGAPYATWLDPPPGDPRAAHRG